MGPARRPSRAAVVALALAVPAAAGLVQRLLPATITHRFPILTFLVAVALVAVWGGRLAALAGLPLCALAGWLFTGHPFDVLTLLVFLAGGGTLAVLLGSTHESRLRAEDQLRARVDAETAARESRRQLELALDAAKMGYWTWDVKEGAVTWSRNLERLHGLPSGSFRGTFEAFLDVVHPEDRSRVKAALQETLETGHEYDIEFRVPWPDGSVRWMNGRGHLERDSAGLAARLFGFAVDVTDRREGEDLRGWLAAIVESSDDAVIGQDASGRILSWNGGAERLFGWTAAEAIGRPAALIVPDGLDEDFDGLLRRVRAGERMEHFETKRRRKDGAVREVSLSVSPVRDSTGRVVGLSKIVRDVTERNAEERERERTREMFLGTLGHDLRNPLNTISVSAFALRRAATGEGVRSLDRILASARRMSRMIDQLLDVARSRLGGGLPVSRRVTNILELLTALVDELEAGGPHRFRIACDGPATGEWDPDRLAQALGNVLGNALEHGEQGSTIDVRVSGTEEHVTVRVTNRGPAIPKDLLPYLFDPFRTSRRGRSQGQGLGLGLYIAEQIVSAHLGRISVETRPDETSFTVELPRQPLTAAAS